MALPRDGTCRMEACASRRPKAARSRAGPEWSIRESSIRIWTHHGSWPNGIKLTLEFLLYQLPPQFLPGCDHEREALGSPLPDARLHPMGAYRVHDHRH